MFCSGRRYAWPVVIDVLKLCLNSEPRNMVRGPRPRHIGPWSTDLEPWIVDSVSRLMLRVPKASPLTRSRSESRETRLYDRGARNVALGRVLLRLFARSRSNWLEDGAWFGRGLRLGLRVVDGSRNLAVISFISILVYRVRC